MSHPVPFQAPRAAVAPVRVDPTGRSGPTRGQAAGRRWRRTSPGLFVPAEVDPSLPEQRIAEALASAPAGSVLTGWAALLMQGAAFLDGRASPATRSGPPRDVAVVVGPGNVRRGGTGVRFLQDRAVTGVRAVHGLPCAPPERALLDEVRLAPGPRAAVVAVDAVLAAGLLALPAWTAYLATCRGRRGVARARWSALWASEGVRSPPETMVRLMWCWDAGLPRPLVNPRVQDAAGRLLGIPDLLDPHAGLGVEYDGADHRAVQRQTRDNHREDRFREHGLELVRVTALDLRDPPALAARLRAARERALASRRPRRWVLTEG